MRLISWQRMLESSTFSCGKLMSLSCSMVVQMFCMNWGRSVTGMLSLMSCLLLVLSMRNCLRLLMLLSQFSFSRYCNLEGRKNTCSSNTSAKFTCDLSAGLGILLQASFTLAMSFSFSACGFSFFYTKSRTTNTICLGFSDPNSFRFSSRMT